MAEQGAESVASSGREFSMLNPPGAFRRRQIEAGQSVLAYISSLYHARQSECQAKGVRAVSLFTNEA